MTTADSALPKWMATVYPGGIPDGREREFQAAARLMMRFESIGLNCRLGFAQRAYRIEPISLLRWAGMRLDDVISGLSSGWAGLDDPTKMHLNYRPDLGHFTAIINRITFHTDEKNPDAHMDTLIAGLIKRNRFLVRKLNDDLRNNEKLFCLFVNSESVDCNKIDEISIHLRNCNSSNKLLVVQNVADSKLFGSVSIESPNLIYGYKRPKEDILENGFIFSDWLSICRQAAEHWAAPETAERKLEMA